MGYYHEAYGARSVVNAPCKKGDDGAWNAWDAFDDARWPASSDSDGIECFRRDSSFGRNAGRDARRHCPNAAAYELVRPIPATEPQRPTANASGTAQPHPRRHP